MSSTFQCGDNTALVSYLYDECEPAERSAIDAHIALCAACVAEIAALESARLQLTSWTPPEADLEFAVVRSGPRRPTASAGRGVLNPRAWLRRPLPVWGQAVAACVIFGAGLSLGVLRGITPTESSTPRQTMASEANTATSLETSTGRRAASAGLATASELTALERRLRAEIATLRGVPAVATSVAPPANGNAHLLAQVRALIDESEQRQQRQLALRTAQVVRDFDLQRQVDLAQIQRDFGQIEGLTSAEVREQRQMLNYLLRVSEQR